MKLKHFIYMIVAGAGFISCSNDNSLTGIEEPIPVKEKVTVSINLQQDIQISTTRATEPMPLENANKLYDIWILHYTEEGLLVRSDLKQETLSTAAIETTLNPELTVKRGEKGTICLVANVGGKTMEWPENLGDLKRTLVLDLPIDNTGLYTNRMYMFGYYEGIIEDGMNLNILMGRMAACMNIVISANSTYTISTTITNAVSNTHFYPMEEGNDRGKLKYFTFNDSGKNVSSDSPLTLYYYTGENIAPEADKRTTIRITANSTEEGSVKTYTIDLGSDAPDTANRNYSIYRNNNYTFNINLN